MQYKLKQDTLENKAGEIFTRRDVNGVDSFVPPSGDADRAIAVTDDRLALFDEINIATSRSFTPKIGGTYYFVDDKGSIVQYLFGQTVDDADRAALGNMFKTKAEATASISFAKARAALRAHPLNQYQPDWSAGVETTTTTIPPETLDGVETTETVERVVPVAYAISINRVTKAFITSAVLAQEAPQAVAYYKTEAEAATAAQDQKSNYQAYFAGL